MGISFSKRAMALGDKIKLRWHSLQDIETEGAAKCSSFYNRAWIKLIKAEIAKEDKSKKKRIMNQVQALLKKAKACEKKMGIIGLKGMVMQYENLDEINIGLKDLVELLK